jgi:hypothetical protein
MIPFIAVRIGSKKGFILLRTGAFSMKIENEKAVSWVRNGFFTEGVLNFCVGLKLET